VTTARSGERSRSRSRHRGPAEPTPGTAADQTPDADPESVVRTIVLNALTAAPRSRAQLEAKLAAKGAPEEVARRVLDRFEEVGLVDDAEFARAMVRSAHTGRGLAGRALRQQLRRTGVDEETASAALADLDPEQELATARALVARRLPASSGLAPDKRLNRLASMLARKGYPPSVAFGVAREALAREGAELSEADAEMDD
jgi:regulatory protein